MAELNYDGDIVNSSVQSMSNIVEKFTNLANAMQHATNTIVSARGFNEYIGGISTDSFSSQVNDCQTVGQAIISQIQQGQVQILSYSEDDEEIQAFLDTLDRVDYKNLDLTGIEDHISFGRKAANFFGGLFSDVGAGVLGLAEGLFEFGETGADLVVTGFSTLASIGTSIYDGMTGDNLTDRLQASTRTFVSNKLSENLFNSIYANTEVGRYIKKNAYGFDTVRNVTKGLGYVAGMVGLTAVTGGAATVGLAGSVSAGNLALTAGAFGFASGAEQAWSEGATHSKGLMYGGANAAWEATQWYLGAKIAGIGGMGEGSHIANGIFRSGAGARIGLDTVDSAAEGFVQPALTMIYKNYDGDNFFEKYANAFEANGGWGAVGTNALIGGFGSLLGEIGDARKLLKQKERQKAYADEIFDSSGADKTPDSPTAGKKTDSASVKEAADAGTPKDAKEVFKSTRPLDDRIATMTDTDGLVDVPEQYLIDNNIKRANEQFEIKYDKTDGKYYRYERGRRKNEVSGDYLNDPVGHARYRIPETATGGKFEDPLTGTKYSQSTNVAPGSMGHDHIHQGVMEVDRTTGEIKRFKGGHYESELTKPRPPESGWPEITVVPRAGSEAPNGVYQADWGVPPAADGTGGVMKFSTFFPKSWSKEQVDQAIQEVGKTRPIAINPKKKFAAYYGTIDGVDIVVIDKRLDGNFGSAYPLHPTDDLEDIISSLTGGKGYIDVR